MSLILTHDPNEYALCPPGMHQATIVDAVALGQIETPWGAKPMVSLVVQTELLDETGKPYILAKRFTRSLHEKASLRQALEHLRGKKFTPNELHDGIDLESYVGMPCIILIVHNDTAERTYANIEAFLPPASGKVAKIPENSSGTYQRVKDRPDYKSPDEYAQHVNGAQ